MSSSNYDARTIRPRRRVENGWAFIPHGRTSTLVNVASSQPSTTFAFKFSAYPSYATVLSGSSVSFTLEVSTISGAPQTVSLKVSGLPAGASYTVSSNPVTPTGTITVTISIISSYFSGGTPPGKYTLTITGIPGIL